MNHPPSSRFDVIIAGGGMVGMTLALALANEGMRICVIERDSLTSQLLPAFDGRVSAIALGSQRVLAGAGAWDAMLPHAEPILDIRVSDGASPFFLDYHHEELGDNPFGWIVENRHTRVALHAAAERSANLTMIPRNSIAHYTAEDAGVTLTLAGGEKMQCALLVGADGKNSPLRDMAGIKATILDYRQTALVCTIAHSRPHFGLAQERFLPAGPFAALPMQHNRSSLVWAEPCDRAPMYAGLSPDELAQEIRERVGDYLGDITLEGKVFTYPLMLVIAASYTAPRLALVGDAAHGIHPIAGQGVNLGFRDVAALHDVLSKRFKLGLDLGGSDALADYQRWRRFDNLAMVAVTDGLTRLFSYHAKPVQWARGLGLWGIGKMPGTRKFFMRHAMGLVGDLPELMRAR